MSYRGSIIAPKVHKIPFSSENIINEGLFTLENGIQDLILEISNTYISRDFWGFLEIDTERA